MSDGEISVRDSLKATMGELAGEAPAPVVETPAVVAAPEVEAKTESTPEIEAKAPGANDRDEKGRFAPKEPKVGDTPPAPVETAPLAATEPPETEAIRVPPSLPAAIKAKFKDLDPDVREAFANLEGSVQTAKAEWGRKGERLNRYDEIMAPRLEKFQLQGIDEFTAIKTLLAAQDYLERDPLAGIQYLARSYGVNLQQSAPQTMQPRPGPEGQQAPTANPNLDAALQPLLKQVQTLQQQIDQSTQSVQAQNLAAAKAEIADFSNKPENMYFENVKADVGKRLSEGSADTLADAYEQAIWASKEIRPLLLKAQAVDAAKKNAPDAARQRAASANQAAGSVTGSPTPGAQPLSRGSIGSVRDSLKATMQELGAV